jgi:hypothetical protein
MTLMRSCESVVRLFRTKKMGLQKTSEGMLMCTICAKYVHGCIGMHQCMITGVMDEGRENGKAFRTFDAQAKNKLQCQNVQAVLHIRKGYRFRAFVAIALISKY